MTHTDWLWKGIFFWFCLICHLHIAGVHGRHFDKCLTPDGREGVCAAKRLCREAANEFLIPCRDEINFCCPKIPMHRSAQPQPSFAASAPGAAESKTTKTPIRADRPRQESPYDRNPPGTINNDQRPRKPVQASGRPIDELPEREPQAERYPPEPPYERPRQSVEVYGRPTTNRERSQPPERPERDPNAYETRPKKEALPNRPSDHRPIDVSEDNGEKSRPVPSPREEIPPASRPRDRNEPSIPRPADYERGSKPRPQSDRPSHHPSIDEIDYEASPPRRRKPPRSPPSTEEPSVKPSFHLPNPRDLPHRLPQVPACGVKPYDLYIAGGETSYEHEWPWMTAIFRRHSGSKPKTFQCGGSLINTRYVLTAAHCFIINNVILPASAYVVRLGSHSLNSGEEYAVSNLVLHNNHSGSDFFNDIALVRLSTEVYITDKIAPICLPFRDMLKESFVDRIAVVAGWGDTSFRSDGTRVLKHVSVPIVSNEECAASYRRVRGAVFLARGSDHVMCAGLMEGGKDACQGDSGGPLMLKSADDRWMVIGIVSLGYKCAEPGYPGVYTRVTHYMSWIQANMKSY